MKFHYEQLTEVGKVRSANEDSCGFAETTNGNIFVVCDGMGGHVGGATASKLAVNSIIEFFRMKTYDNLILAIDDAFQFANEQVFAHTIAEPELKGMGTTVALLIIKGEDCYIGHVGDSRIYLKTGDRLHRITKDHSYVQGLVDSNVITDDEAERHPKKNQILKALGHSADVKGTVCNAPLKVQAGDVFMLCSDGLNGMITDAVIEQKIDARNLQESKRDLYQTAMTNGGVDNITIILVGISESNHYAKSVFESFNPKRPAAETIYERNNEQYPSSKAILPMGGGLFKQPIHFLIAGLVVVCLLLPAGYFIYEFNYNKKDTDVKEVKSSKVEKNKRFTKAELKDKNFDELKKMANEKRLVDTSSVSTSEEFKTKDGIEVKVEVKDGVLFKVDKNIVQELITDINTTSGAKTNGRSEKTQNKLPSKKNESLKDYTVRLQVFLKNAKIECNGLSPVSLKSYNKSKFQGAELQKFLRDTIPRVINLDYKCQ